PVSPLTKPYYNRNDYCGNRQRIELKLELK
ncbi:unnamed protein product, partial [marine sediment metagenome]